MNTTKDLLLNKLTATGFMYYPEMKRLMFKKEISQHSEVIVVELDKDKECRVYFSIQNEGSKEYTNDRKFCYNAEQILNYVENLLVEGSTECKIAA
ncbi:MAG: hypothetical protein RR212_13730 [Bacteroidales bacterium]